jgi:hypothetical protein
MRIAVILPLLAALAGCAVVPPQAWNFDPTQPQPKMAMAPELVAELTDRLAQLQLERNSIRARIATERDVAQRVRHYLELHRVGTELSPLERELAGVAAAR